MIAITRWMLYSCDHINYYIFVNSNDAVQLDLMFNWVWLGGTVSLELGGIL